MKVPDYEFDAGKVFGDCRFEIAQTDGLQAHIGIVEVLDRRLDEQNSHVAAVISYVIAATEAVVLSD